jgi:hypothetical protein
MLSTQGSNAEQCLDLLQQFQSNSDTKYLHQLLKLLPKELHPFLHDSQSLETLKTTLRKSLNNLSTPPTLKRPSTHYSSPFAVSSPLSSKLVNASPIRDNTENNEPSWLALDQPDISHSSNESVFFLILF